MDQLVARVPAGLVFLGVTSCSSPRGPHPKPKSLRGQVCEWRQINICFSDTMLHMSKNVKTESQQISLPLCILKP